MRKASNGKCDWTLIILHYNLAGKLCLTVIDVLPLLSANTVVWCSIAGKTVFCCELQLLSMNKSQKIQSWIIQLGNTLIFGFSIRFQVIVCMKDSAKTDPGSKNSPYYVTGKSQNFRKLWLMMSNSIPCKTIWRTRPSDSFKCRFLPESVIIPRIQKSSWGWNNIAFSALPAV